MQTIYQLTVRAKKKPARKAQAPHDDAVDLLPDEDLGERELLLLGELRDRLVADAEQGGTRQALLVGLDLVLDEELVLVLERSVRVLPHACLVAVPGVS